MVAKTIIAAVFLAVIMVFGSARCVAGAIEIAQLSRRSPKQDSDLERFLEAKQHVLEVEWERASEKLESYLEDFPTGNYRDEALYWVARSLNGLARAHTDVENVIDLKLRASHYLDNLLEGHPESVWRNDAEALRMEISGELALMGVKEHRKYIEELARKYGSSTAEGELQSDEDAYRTILALHTLTVLEPAVVVPILKRTLRSDPRIEIRKEVMSLMAEEYPEDALPVLREIEGTDPHKELRAAASRLIDVIKETRIPVYLNYYAFRLRLEDQTQRMRIPEGELALFDLPRKEAGSVNKVEKALKDFFGGKASGVSIVTFSFKVARSAALLAAAGLPELMSQHEVDGFRVELPFRSEDFAKHYNQISGKVRFLDLESRQSYERAYTVDASNDKLFVMRIGDKVAAFVLQFESAGEHIEVPKEPKYNMYFDDILGARLRTTRRTVSAEELTNQTARVDHGQARAEIPGDDGEWVLIGHILVDTEDRLFIGRKATLLDPKGKPVVQAAEIVVPAESPEEFYVARFE